MTDKEVPFRYAAKASRSERDLGCEHLYWTQEEGKWIRIEKNEYDHLEQKDKGPQVTTGNIHPTVKPIEVMEWLVSTLSQEGDHILDPFCGSGTTGIAAMRQGRSCSLIDLDEDDVYRNIIEGRLHGQKEALLDELPPHQRPDILFEGEISKEHPAKFPDEVSFKDLFGSLLD